MKVHSKPVALFVCPECGHTATMYEDGAPASETTEAQPERHRNYKDQQITALLNHKDLVKWIVSQKRPGIFTLEILQGRAARNGFKVSKPMLKLILPLMVNRGYIRHVTRYSYALNK